ncbi:MAG: hypothetical protein GY796_06915 [Chloroflexi bacterium]|nr:hypothetical protein [Chloroflexota bacterium]
MNRFETMPQIQQITQQLDRLIAEMITLRQQVVALNPETPSTETQSSVRQAEYFGMWAGREDMQGRSSREWLEDLRSRQWVRQ